MASNSQEVLLPLPFWVYDHTLLRPLSAMGSLQQRAHQMNSSGVGLKVHRTQSLDMGVECGKGWLGPLEDSEEVLRKMAPMDPILGFSVGLLGKSCVVFLKKVTSLGFVSKDLQPCWVCDQPCGLRYELSKGVVAFAFSPNTMPLLAGYHGL